MSESFFMWWHNLRCRLGDFGPWNPVAVLRWFDKPTGKEPQ